MEVADNFEINTLIGLDDKANGTIWKVDIVVLEKNLEDLIRNALNSRDYPKWIMEDFSRIKGNKLIRLLLERAYLETAQRDYKNKHGIIHGLATAYTSIQLFELIERDVVKSDYQNIIGLSKEEVLFTLMTACFIHDTGRFYDDAIANHQEYVDDAISILEKMLLLGDILSQSSRIGSEEMVKRIRELCLCHDKKEEPSGKAEIAIVKLADALDVGPHRVYTIEDKPELSGDKESRLRLIFKKDMHPGRYFGPLSIEGVTINWNNSREALEVEFRIKDYACAEEIKKVLNILNACTRSNSDAVRIMSSKIHVYIVDPESNRYRLHPEEITARAFVRAPRIADTRLTYVGYGIDVLNMEGDAEIDLTSQIKNIRNESGLDSHQIVLGGSFPSSWKDLNMKWFEAEIEGPRELSQPKYLRSEKGTEHFFLVEFGRKIKINESIMLNGKCKWPRFANVTSDQFTHTVSTPTEKLKIDILFPREVSNGLVSSIEARDIVDESIIFTSPVEPKKMGERWRIVYETNVLAPVRTYRLFWKMSE